jgi:hypothetical protein
MAADYPGIEKLNPTRLAGDRIDPILSSGSGFICALCVICGYLRSPDLVRTLTTNFSVDDYTPRYRPLELQLVLHGAAFKRADAFLCPGSYFSAAIAPFELLPPV